MSSLLEEVEAIAEHVFERKFSQLAQSHTESQCIDPEASELRRRLARINAKEHISVGEAAILLSCSDGHIRNLVQRAIDERTEHPIPFRDLDGVVVFPIQELLEWSRIHKPKTKKAIKKAKPQLRAVSS
jgi:hypothetical protein